MRDLMPPGAVALRKAVQKNQGRGINRSLINHIELDPVRKRDALLLHRQPSASIFSI